MEDNRTDVQRTPSYVVFTFKGTDVLVKVDGWVRHEDICRMLDTTEPPVGSSVSASDAVKAAMAAAGIEKYEVVTVGSMCHIHL